MSCLESTGPDTWTQLVRCRHERCEWGFLFQLGEDSEAETIRASHERHCRHRPDFNLM